MRAVILAGGLGTRLPPYTTVIPKPLVPVGGRPVLEHIIWSLHRSGVRQVELCVSHLGSLIRLYLLQACRTTWSWAFIGRRSRSVPPGRCERSPGWGERSSR